MTDPPDDPERTRRLLEIEKRRAEIGKLDIETRKTAREFSLYPLVVATGLVLATVALAKLFT